MVGNLSYEIKCMVQFSFPVCLLCVRVSGAEYYIAGTDYIVAIRCFHIKQQCSFADLDEVFFQGDSLLLN